MNFNLLFKLKKIAIPFIFACPSKPAVVEYHPYEYYLPAEYYLSISTS